MSRGEKEGFSFLNMIGPKEKCAIALQEWFPPDIAKIIAFLDNRSPFDIAPELIKFEYVASIPSATLEVTREKEQKV